MPPFADAEFSFEAHIVSSLAGFPHNLTPSLVRPAPVQLPANAHALFEALRLQFQIRDALTASDKATEAASSEFPVRKYLPLSYRQAFNFTTPRTRAAVTDDSYRCAVRNAVKVPGFKRDTDEVSWGKVFAYALRQPLLASELGMIYATTIEVDAAPFEHGGWLYIDLAEGSSFRDQQQADDDFLKKYAARIPPLKPNESRSLFAPILFPVLFKKNAGDPDPLPDGTFDQLLIETAEYDDGFAKIVHAHQPQSRNLLAETPEEGKPVKDAGIRLGWDDEQILIWYLRQLAADSSVKDLYDKRLDAPLGVLVTPSMFAKRPSREAMGDLERGRKPEAAFSPGRGSRNQSGSAISRASFPTRFTRCGWMEIRTAITGSRCISRIGPATAWCCRTRTRPKFIKRTAAQVKPTRKIREIPARV